jgi:hypothetical protein
VALRIVGGGEREVSNLRRSSVVAGPAGLELKSDCAGEGRLRLWAADCPHVGGEAPPIGVPATVSQWWKSGRGTQICALFRGRLPD